MVKHRRARGDHGASKARRRNDPGRRGVVRPFSTMEGDVSGSDEAASSGEPPLVLTAAHVRAARGLLGWSTADLAAKIWIDETSVRDFEEGRRELPAGQIAALRSAFTTAGVAFTNGGAPGVRLERSGIDEGTRASDLTTENDR